MSRFKEMPNHPGQVWLFPPSLDDMLPADADVRVLKEVMEELDWSVLEMSYSDTGCPAYPPKVMTSILVYAYSRGIRSSRKIEELVNYDIRYMWLAGGLRPDFHTIARFRKDKLAEFAALYADTVRLCQETGLVLMHVLAVDGSKIAAAASKRSLYNEKRLSRELDAVEKILREAEEVDKAEDELYGQSNGRDIPDELKDAKRRREKLKELAQRLKEEKRKSMSSSDPEARNVKTRKGIGPGYNLQAAVDSESQVIVGMKLLQNENDYRQLIGMVDEATDNTGFLPSVVLADKGYCDEQTLCALDERGQRALVPPQENPQTNKPNDLFSSKCFLYDEVRDVVICPASKVLYFRREERKRKDGGVYREYTCRDCGGCSFQSQCAGDGKCRSVDINLLRYRMRESLKSDEGRELFSLRKMVVEPVFGQIKRNLGFERFMLWGLKGARVEAYLMCMVHNLLKCLRNKVRLQAQAA